MFKIKGIPALRMIVILGCLHITASASAQKDLFRLADASPELYGYKRRFFEMTTRNALKEIPSIGSLLVWREKGLICEKYFNGADKHTAFKVKSVTKSVVSALAGIAKDNGSLPDLSIQVVKLFPEYANDIPDMQNLWYEGVLKETDSLRRILKVRDLFTMQAGFLWDDNDPLSHRAFHTSSDAVRFVLDLPFGEVPGSQFRYCTGASHVAGAIVSKGVNMSLEAYADSMLFSRIGIEPPLWTKDLKGRNAGGSELSLRPSDMMKFGLLFLNEGKAGGRQVISKEWIKESTGRQVALDKWDVLPGANGYGYYWWRRITNGHQAYVASGYGGQLICIIPDLEMVIVTTCFVNDSNRGRSEIKRLHAVIDRIVKASE